LQNCHFEGFFPTKYEAFQFGRLLSLLPEAAQMTQNKKKKNTYIECSGRLEGYINFCLPTPLNQVASSIKNIPARFLLTFLFTKIIL
jgi:hypothetical protein